MRIALIILSFALATLTGCNSLERNRSVQKKSLEALIDAAPVGISHDLARAHIQGRGWKITSDTKYTNNWPDPRQTAEIDSLITVTLPSRVGVPFRILVFGYIGLKDGKVVRHLVRVEENAL